MNVGHVEGGTHAGWKIQKQPVMWSHTCGADLVDATTGKRLLAPVVSLSAYSCPACGTRRP